MVLSEACGFGLEWTGNLWPEQRAFLEGDGVGEVAETGSQVLSSSNPNIPTTERIEARGPVGGCAGGGGNYAFVTPLGALGIGLTFPTDFNAGSFGTDFSNEDGVTSVVHSVSLPLPDPITPPDRGGGGGRVGSATNEYAVFRTPINPLPLGDTSPQRPDMLTVEPLPDNQIKGSVRVEVVNSTSGIIASGWATYHLICVPGSGRGTVTPGLMGPDVLALQTGLNRWLEEQDLPSLILDGRFERETERVVRQFQLKAGLKKDGMVGRHTWRALMARSR